MHKTTIALFCLTTLLTATSTANADQATCEVTHFLAPVGLEAPVALPANAHFFYLPDSADPFFCAGQLPAQAHLMNVEDRTLLSLSINPIEPYGFEVEPADALIAGQQYAIWLAPDHGAYGELEQGELEASLEGELAGTLEDQLAPDLIFTAEEAQTPSEDELQSQVRLGQSQLGQATFQFFEGANGFLVDVRIEFALTHDRTGASMYRLTYRAGGDARVQLLRPGAPGTESVRTLSEFIGVDGLSLNQASRRFQDTDFCIDVELVDVTGAVGAKTTACTPMTCIHSPDAEPRNGLPNCFEAEEAGCSTVMPANTPLNHTAPLFLMGLAFWTIRRRRQSVR